MFMFPKVGSPRCPSKSHFRLGDLGTSESIDAQLALKVPQKSARFIKKLRSHGARNPYQVTVSLRILLAFWALQKAKLEFQDINVLVKLVSSSKPTRQRNVLKVVELVWAKLSANQK